jgi:hypothetical protein
LERAVAAVPRYRDQADDEDWEDDEVVCDVGCLTAPGGEAEADEEPNGGEAGGCEPDGSCQVWASVHRDRARKEHGTDDGFCDPSVISIEGRRAVNGARKM